MDAENQVTVFMCGPPKDHKCDDNGPVVYGKEDGDTTTDKNEKGITWGSTSCSVCGMTSMEQSMWESW